MLVLLGILDGSFIALSISAYVALPVGYDFSSNWFPSMKFVVFTVDFG